MQQAIKRIIEWDNRQTKNIRIDPSSKISWRMATILAHSGDSWYCLSVLLLIWLFSKNEWRTIAAAMGSSIFILAVIIILIKISIRRKRPAGEWGDIYRLTDPHSFPSGHATRVFFMASMAWGIAPIWFAILLTIWAPLVALSRIQTGLHYLSDVLAGVLLGWILGKFAILLIPNLILWFPWAF
ncbi:MAG: phosphatase PAP2 family protein [Anaerolineaceae bacterium]|nr:phosphatase PAP2 family protein [Anaerolineaceae bacterium]